jgi:hypothetical protein
MASSSTLNAKGRYIQGGQTTVYPNRIGWWNRFIIAKDPITDVEFKITSQFVGRPDLIAHLFYKQTRYMWVIMQYNDIIDPLTELSLGTKILVPSEARVNLVLLGSSVDTTETPDEASGDLI